MSERVARSRELVAKGYALAVVARVLQVTRQALYRTPKPRTAPQRRPAAEGSVEQAIVETAKENPTDGYRMVWALTRRKLGIAINRKRVLRVMRQHGLIQRRRREPRRRRPGFFRVTRPAELWHMDMERHEAPSNRAEMKGLRLRPVAAGRVKLGAARARRRG